MISTPEYQVIVVTKENYELRENEYLGTKDKFWFKHENLDYLYKQARPNIGEDWAEKVAAELCELLGIPHAVYELAETWEGKRGVASLNFLQEKEGEALVNGNELLAAIVPNYNTSATYGASQHTIDIVLKAIENEAVDLPLNWISPVGIQTAVELFVGYLLLDAWIGNGDRHHENWGFIRKKMMPAATETVYLAPTYDHASSLGRELSDANRQKKSLQQSSVEAYANKCYSAFYRSFEDTKSLKTFDVVTYVAQIYPKAINIWLERLSSITSANILEIFTRIPSNRISPIAIDFAQKILKYNQHRLLNFKEELF